MSLVERRRPSENIVATADNLLGTHPKQDGEYSVSDHETTSNVRVFIARPLNYSGKYLRIFNEAHLRMQITVIEKGEEMGDIRIPELHAIYSFRTGFIGRKLKVTKEMAFKYAGEEKLQPSTKHPETIFINEEDRNRFEMTIEEIRKRTYPVNDEELDKFATVLQEVI